MVFEGWVVDHISSWLGHFVEIQREQLRISLWRAWRTGLTLEDVKLRSDAFEYLQLPFRLRSGRIARVQAHVPWGARIQPVVVELDDVVLVLELRAPEDLSSGAARGRAREAKRALLASLAAAAAARGGAPTGDEAPRDGGSGGGGGGGARGDGPPAVAPAGGATPPEDEAKATRGVLLALAHRALAAVAGRLRLAVRGISVTLVDADSGAEVTVRAPALRTVSAQAAATFLAGDLGGWPALADARAAASLSRHFVLEGLRVEWRPPRPRERPGLRTARGGPNSSGVAANGDPAGRLGCTPREAPLVPISALAGLAPPALLLFPTDVVLHVATSAPGSGPVSLRCEVAIPDLALCVQADQVPNVAAFIDATQLAALRARHAPYLPDAWRRGARGPAVARAMWRFAVNATIAELAAGGVGEATGLPEQARRRRCGERWHPARARAHMRARYVRLWRAEIVSRTPRGGSPMGRVGRSQLEALEAEMPAADILACRAVAAACERAATRARKEGARAAAPKLVPPGPGAEGAVGTPGGPASPGGTADGLVGDEGSEAGEGPSSRPLSPGSEGPTTPASQQEPSSGGISWGIAGVAGFFGYVPQGQSKGVGDGDDEAPSGKGDGGVPTPQDARRLLAAAMEMSEVKRAEEGEGKGMGAGPQVPQAGPKSHDEPSPPEPSSLLELRLRIPRISASLGDPLGAGPIASAEVRWLVAAAHVPGGMDEPSDVRVALGSLRVDECLSRGAGVSEPVLASADDSGEPLLSLRAEGLGRPGGGRVDAEIRALRLRASSRALEGLARALAGRAGGRPATERRRSASEMAVVGLDALSVGSTIPHSRSVPDRPDGGEPAGAGTPEAGRAPPGGLAALEPLALPGSTPDTRTPASTFNLSQARAEALARLPRAAREAVSRTGAGGGGLALPEVHLRLAALELVMPLPPSGPGARGDALLLCLGASLVRATEPEDSAPGTLRVDARLGGVGAALVAEEDMPEPGGGIPRRAHPPLLRPTALELSATLPGPGDSRAAPRVVVSAPQALAARVTASALAASEAVAEGWRSAGEALAAALGRVAYPGPATAPAPLPTFDLAISLARIEVALVSDASGGTLPSARAAPPAKSAAGGPAGEGLPRPPPSPDDALLAADAISVQVGLRGRGGRARVEAALVSVEDRAEHASPPPVNGPFLPRLARTITAAKLGVGVTWTAGAFAGELGPSARPTPAATLEVELKVEDLACRGYQGEPGNLIGRARAGEPVRLRYALRETDRLVHNVVEARGAHIGHATLARIAVLIDRMTSKGPNAAPAVPGKAERLTVLLDGCLVAWRYAPHVAQRSSAASPAHDALLAHGDIGLLEVPRLALDVALTGDPFGELAAEAAAIGTLVGQDATAAALLSPSSPPGHPPHRPSTSPGGAPPPAAQARILSSPGTPMPAPPPHPSSPALATPFTPARGGDHVTLEASDLELRLIAVGVPGHALLPCVRLDRAKAVVGVGEDGVGPLSLELGSLELGAHPSHAQLLDAAISVMTAELLALAAPDGAPTSAGDTRRAGGTQPPPSGDHAVDDSGPQGPEPRDGAARGEGSSGGSDAAAAPGPPLQLPANLVAAASVSLLRLAMLGSSSGSAALVLEAAGLAAEVSTGSRLDRCSSVSLGWRTAAAYALSPLLEGEPEGGPLGALPPGSPWAGDDASAGAGPVLEPPTAREPSADDDGFFDARSEIASQPSALSGLADATSRRGSGSASRYFSARFGLAPTGSHWDVELDPSAASGALLPCPLPLAPSSPRHAATCLARLLCGAGVPGERARARVAPPGLHVAIGPSGLDARLRRTTLRVHLAAEAWAEAVQCLSTYVVLRRQSPGMPPSRPEGPDATGRAPGGPTPDPGTAALAGDASREVDAPRAPMPVVVHLHDAALEVVGAETPGRPRVPALVLRLRAAAALDAPRDASRTVVSIPAALLAVAVVPAEAALAPTSLPVPAERALFGLARLEASVLSAHCEPSVVPAASPQGSTPPPEIPVGGSPRPSLTPRTPEPAPVSPRKAAAPTTSAPSVRARLTVSHVTAWLCAREVAAAAALAKDAKALAARLATAVEPLLVGSTTASSPGASAKPAPALELEAVVGTVSALLLADEGGPAPQPLLEVALLGLAARGGAAGGHVRLEASLLARADARVRAGVEPVFDPWRAALRLSAPLATPRAGGSGLAGASEGDRALERDPFSAPPPSPLDAVPPPLHDDGQAHVRAELSSEETLEVTASEAGVAALAAALRELKDAARGVAAGRRPVSVGAPWLLENACGSAVEAWVRAPGGAGRPTRLAVPPGGTARLPVEAPPGRGVLSRSGVPSWSRGVRVREGAGTEGAASGPLGGPAGPSSGDPCGWPGDPLGAEGAWPSLCDDSGSSGSESDGSEADLSGADAGRRTLLSFRVAGGERVGPVSLGTPGEYAFPPAPGASARVFARVEVAPDGRTRVLLHSGVRLTNDSLLEVEVALRARGDVAWAPPPVPPGGSVWLPVLAAAPGALSVRPTATSAATYLAASPVRVEPPPLAHRAPLGLGEALGDSGPPSTRTGKVGSDPGGPLPRSASLSSAQLPWASYASMASLGGGGGGGGGSLPWFARDFDPAEASAPSSSAPEASEGDVSWPSGGSSTGKARAGGDGWGDGEPPRPDPRRAPTALPSSGSIEVRTSDPAGYGWSPLVSLAALLRACPADGRARAALRVAPLSAGGRQLELDLWARRGGPAARSPAVADLRLSAPLALANGLPVPAELSVRGERGSIRAKLDPGERLDVYEPEVAECDTALVYVPGHAVVGPLLLPSRGSHVAAGAGGVAGHGGGTGGAPHGDGSSAAMGGGGRAHLQEGAGAPRHPHAPRVLDPGASAPNLHAFEQTPPTMASDAAVPDAPDARLPVPLTALGAAHGGVDAHLLVRGGREGGAASRTLHLGCPFWVYNCARMPLAIRRAPEAAFASDVRRGEAQPLTEDVPDVWVPPLALPGEGDGPDEDEAPPRGIAALARPSGGASGGGGGGSAQLGAGTQLGTLPQSMAGSIFNEPPSPSVPPGLAGARRNGGGARPPGPRPIARPSRGIQDSMEREPEFFRPTKWPSMHRSLGGRAARPRLQLRASQAVAAPGRSHWSEGVRLDALGAAAVVAAPRPLPGAPRAAVLLAVTASPAPLGAPGTLALRILPRHVLHNALPVPVQVRQAGTRTASTVPAGGARALAWPDASRARRVRIRVHGAGWLWSGGFDPDAPGDAFVKLRHRDRGETLLLRVDVAGSNRGTLHVTLSHTGAGFAPYRLENHSLYALHVRQARVQDAPGDVIRPYCCLRYAWDEPALPHVLQVALAGGAQLGSWHLDAVGIDEVVRGPRRRAPTLRVVIRAEGPTRVLAVIDPDRHPAAAPPARPDRQARPDWEVALLLSGLGLSLPGPERAGGARAASAATAAASPSRDEVAYARLAGAELRLRVSEARVELRAAAGRVQLDDPRPWKGFPVVLVCPAPAGPLSRVRRAEKGGTNLGAGRSLADAAAADGERAVRALRVRCAVWRRRPGGVQCVEDAELRVQPVALYIQQEHAVELASHLARLAEAARGGRDQGWTERHDGAGAGDLCVTNAARPGLRAAPPALEGPSAAGTRAQTPAPLASRPASSFGPPSPLDPRSRAASLGTPGGLAPATVPALVADDPGVRDVAEWDVAAASREWRLYLARVRVSPLELIVTFAPARYKHHPDGSGDQDGADVGEAAAGGGLLDAGAIARALLSLADVEDARVSLASLRLDDAVLGADALAARVQRHYVRALLPQVVRVVGAASVLGDPLRLVHHLRLGVWSFLATPAAGLVESAREWGPSAFLVALRTGTTQGLANVAFALSNATAKASRAAHRALVAVGAAREALVRPGEDGHGLATSSSAARDGLLGALLAGIAGTVAEPIIGAERDGLRGLIRGIGRGASGAAVLPLAALLEMLARTAASIRAAVAGRSSLGWARPPRLLGYGGQLGAYDFPLALAGWVLAQLHGRQVRSRPARALLCVRLEGDDEWLVVTAGEVLQVHAPPPRWVPTLRWHAAVRDVEVVRQEDADPAAVVVVAQRPRRRFRLVSPAEGGGARGPSPPLPLGATSLAEEFWEQPVVPREVPRRASIAPLDVRAVRCAGGAADAARLVEVLRRAAADVPAEASFDGGCLFVLPGAPPP